MKKISWTERCYRFPHAVHRLHVGMVSGEYEKPIDNFIVSFNRRYIIWRIALLLKPLQPLGKDAVISILQDTINYLEESWFGNTQLKDDSSRSTPR